MELCFVQDLFYITQATAQHRVGGPLQISGGVLSKRSHYILGAFVKFDGIVNRNFTPEGS